jgi:hypothetical protein
MIIEIISALWNIQLPIQPDSEPSVQSHKVKNSTPAPQDYGLIAVTLLLI